MPSLRHYRGYRITIEWEPRGWIFSIADLYGPSEYFYRSAWGAMMAARRIIDVEEHDADADANSDDDRAA